MGHRDDRFHRRDEWRGRDEIEEDRTGELARRRLTGPGYGDHLERGASYGGGYGGPYAGGRFEDDRDYGPRAPVHPAERRQLWGRSYGTRYGGHYEGGGGPPENDEWSPEWSYQSHHDLGWRGRDLDRGDWGRRGDMARAHHERGILERAGHWLERKLGRAPKGYIRSDERIREDVCDQIVRAGWIDAGEVEIQVKDGEVMLSGTVVERREKRAIEDIAEDVFGVKDVRNDLRVRPAGPTAAPSDEPPEVDRVPMRGKDGKPRPSS